jgi:hypothetical protein
MGFFRAVADDETVVRLPGSRRPDGTSLLHGAEHVDRLVDGEDAFCVAIADGALAAAKDEDFPVIWSLKDNKGNTIMAMPRAACYRGMVMSHMIHHRAQLGVYLRLNDLELPGMYGPSADEMKFWNEKKG